MTLIKPLAPLLSLLLLFSCAEDSMFDDLPSDDNADSDGVGFHTTVLLDEDIDLSWLWQNTVIGEDLVPEEIVGREQRATIIDTLTPGGLFTDERRAVSHQFDSFTQHESVFFNILPEGGNFVPVACLVDPETKQGTCFGGDRRRTSEDRPNGTTSAWLRLVSSGNKEWFDLGARSQLIVTSLELYESSGADLGLDSTGEYSIRIAYTPSPPEL